MQARFRSDENRLFELLPAVYRAHDELRGGPLRALLRRFSAQANDLREEAWTLWRAQFVETCPPWVLPYIADLIGTTPLLEAVEPGTSTTAQQRFTDRRGSDRRELDERRPDRGGPTLTPRTDINSRAEIADTIAFRRSRGTPAMLARMARAVSEWPACVIEFRDRLARAAYVPMLRGDGFDGRNAPTPATVAVRDPSACGARGSAFDVAPYTLDVRRADSHLGWYRAQAVGLFLWRLRSHSLVGEAAALDASRGLYSFSSVGLDEPLFAATRSGLAADEHHVPAAVRPSLFRAECAPGHLGERYYGEDGAFQVPGFAAAEVVCANLGVPFQRPDDARVYIDVTRGRLLIGRAAEQRFPAEPDGTLRVPARWHRGSPADLGGGGYARGAWLAVAPTRPDEVVALARSAPGTPYSPYPGATAMPALATLQEAVDAALARLTADPGLTGVRIVILDSATYTAAAGPLNIHLPHARTLTIESADRQWPTLRVESIVLTADSATKLADDARVTLDGLRIDARLVVGTGVTRCRIVHSTVVPRAGQDRIVSDTEHPGQSLDVAFSIVGRIVDTRAASSLWLLDAIVDGGIRGTPRLRAERSTILGAAEVEAVDLATDCIFADPVTARLSEGCIRYSHVPPGSSTPRQFQCQPAAAIQRADGTPGEAEVAAHNAPRFASLNYGHPEYARLRDETPASITAGAERGGEMGAFCHLETGRRAANLRIRLDEYLPVGLDAAVIYVN